MDVAVETPSELSNADEDFLKEQASLLPSLHIPRLSTVTMSLLMPCCNVSFILTYRGALPSDGALSTHLSNGVFPVSAIPILQRR